MARVNSNDSHWNRRENVHSLGAADTESPGGEPGQVAAAQQGQPVVVSGQLKERTGRKKLGTAG